MKWSPADEQRLSEMNAAGASVSAIATAMKRIEAAIENRIHVLKQRAGRPRPPQIERASSRRLTKTNWMLERRARTKDARQFSCQGHQH